MVEKTDKASSDQKSTPDQATPPGSLTSRPNLPAEKQGASGFDKGKPFQDRPDQAK